MSLSPSFRTATFSMLIDRVLVLILAQVFGCGFSLGAASWPAMANLAPLLSSASEHWLTPPAFLELVRRVFGGVIDLDPATNRWSQVAASKNCINGEIDGLSIPWRGNVYCNPPYGDAIVAFTNRMRQLAGELRTCSLIALLPARIDTAWCQDDVIASADA